MGRHWKVALRFRDGYALDVVQTVGLNVYCSSGAERILPQQETGRIKENISSRPGLLAFKPWTRSCCLWSILSGRPRGEAVKRATGGGNSSSARVFISPKAARRAQKSRPIW